MSYADELRAAIAHADALVEFFEQWEAPSGSIIDLHPCAFKMRNLRKELRDELATVELDLVHAWYTALKVG